MNTEVPKEKKLIERPYMYVLAMFATAITALWFQQLATQAECRKCPDQFTEYLRTSNVQMIQSIDRNSTALEKHTEVIESLKK